MSDGRIPHGDLTMKSFVGTRTLSCIGREVYEDSMRVVLRIDDEYFLFTGWGDGWRDQIDSIERVGASSDG